MRFNVGLFKPLQNGILKPPVMCPAKEVWKRGEVNTAITVAAEGT